MSDRSADDKYNDSADASAPQDAMMDSGALADEEVDQAAGGAARAKASAYADSPDWAAAKNANRDALPEEV